MENKDILLQIEELIELDPGTLTGSEALGDLEGWDSLAVVQFLAFADEHFGVVLSPKRVASCETVNDLVALVNGKDD